MTSNRQFSGAKSVQTKIPWLWIFVISFVLILTQFSMFHVQDRLAPGTGNDYVLRRQVSIPFLGLLGAMFFVTAKGWRVRWNPPLLAACVLLGAWILLSIQWSNNPSLALRRLIVLFLIFVAAYGVTVKWPKRALLYLVVFAAGVQLTVGLVSEILDGSFAPANPGYRFSGNLGPNGEGQLCAVFALASIAAIPSADRYKIFFRSAALYGIVFLLLTQSLTSLAGFLAGFTAYSFLRFSAGGRLRFVYLGVMIALIVGLLGLAYGFSIDPIAKATGRDPEGLTELTGRIPLWVECMTYIEARPIKGYGFEGVWRPDNTGEIEAATGWLAGSAHSAYLDLWLALGFVGLALHTSILLLLLRRAAKIHRMTRAPVYAAAAALSVQYLVFGGLESTSLIRFSSILFFSYCLFLMVALTDTSKTTQFNDRGLADAG